MYADCACTESAAEEQKMCLDANLSESVQIELVRILLYLVIHIVDYPVGTQHIGRGATQDEEAGPPGRGGSLPTTREFHLHIYLRQAMESLWLSCALILSFQILQASDHLQSSPLHAQGAFQYAPEEAEGTKLPF